mmetsp:Transcript_33921/g.38762  ORF Transcript_33921/g.38762 Transcript_33921/m.38762 type:complete len:168 (-) Transcript_33921:444-947(-)
MGRNWSRKRKKNNTGDEKPRDGNVSSKKSNPDWGKERDPRSLVQIGNFKMEAYYAYQGIHDFRLEMTTTVTSSVVECFTAMEKETERQRWLTSMKSILPISFRIGNDVDPSLRERLELELEEFVGKKMRIEVEPKGGNRRLQREQQNKEQEEEKEDKRDGRLQGLLW